MRYALLLLFACAASAQTPACRFDDSLAAEVRNAATLVLGEPIAVNAQEASGTIRIEIVRDAACGKKTPDQWTVAGGVCLANPETRTVRCSANALSALTTLDRRAKRASPALLYVIAHELAHLEQKKAGAFTGSMAMIALASSEEAKWRALRRVCEEPPAGRELEEAADQAALKVLQRAADRKEYRDPLLSPRAAVYTITDRLRLAAHELAQFEGPSMPRPAALEETFEPTPESVARTARLLLCEIRNGKKGVLALPNVPGSHPDEPTRLFAIATVLRERARELPSKNDLPPELPDLQPVSDVVSSLGDITAVMHRQEKELYEQLWPHLCETWLNPQRWPDCSE
ncbi:MAG TPA: hypothetical protein VGF48_07985 [Thermoanaerobaculia bacterium]